jgi:hypothetical protein
MAFAECDAFDTAVSRCHITPPSDKTATQQTFVVDRFTTVVRRKRGLHSVNGQYII